MSTSPMSTPSRRSSPRIARQSDPRSPRAVPDARESHEAAAARGQPAFGTFMGLGSTLGAEQLAHTGFDWLVIDQEHGAIDAALTQALLQAISTTETVPLIRVPSVQADWIGRALDAGAYGVIVPSVNTRAEAEAAVRATRYPPLGERGIGGSRTRLYGGDDYGQHANEEILLIAQIEHRDGVANAEQILSVPGIDAYFIGPGDLCARLRLPHNWGPWAPRADAILAAATAVRETERIKVILAHRPGFVNPGVFAMMCASLDRASRGRMALNIVTAGAPGDMEQFGDDIDHDQRYAR